VLVSEHEQLLASMNERKQVPVSVNEHKRVMASTNECKQVPATMNECKCESRWAQMSVDVYKQEQMGRWVRQMHTGEKKPIGDSKSVYYR